MQYYNTLPLIVMFLNTVHIEFLAAQHSHNDDKLLTTHSHTTGSYTATSSLDNIHHLLKKVLQCSSNYNYCKTHITSASYS